MLSFAEENYLKAIYHLSEGGSEPVSTNSLADNLETKAASVTDMIKKLAQKQVIDYKKYYGVNLSDSGKSVALQIIRKHRLWEVFLVNNLEFKWDEVHEVAEQLEHIKSPLLIQRLDKFLGFPKYDPHGDPIPDENGKLTTKPRTELALAKKGQQGVIVAVNDSNSAFLKYLDKIGARIGTPVEVIDKVEFDGSLEIKLGEKVIFVSKEVSTNILISE